jgi:tetratricopeptide (TPR) repeat protein
VLALRDFEQVLKLDPDNGDAYNGRGYARVKLDQYRPAVEDAREALRRGPRTARMAYNAARIYAQAVGKLEIDKTLPAPRARELASEYQDSALALLRQALDLLPAPKRPAFWEQTVQPDSALNPIRRSNGFLQLAAPFAQQPPRPSGPK